jgi:hypothetical protein
MSKYTLLLRESGRAFANLSPSEMQQIIARYGAWSDGLRKAGSLGPSNKLTDGAGRVIRRTGGKVMVTDGPFTEGKEVLGGYFTIEAESYDKAIEIASSCPHMDFGSIEVREVEVMPARV